MAANFAGKANRKAYTPSYMEGGETCVVCDHRATGYHYNAMTCEACKLFFRRTEQKGKKYRCKATKRCTIKYPLKKACQSCRYQKCLAKGMAKDLVKDELARMQWNQLIQRNREKKAREATRSRDPLPTPPLTPPQLQFMESVQLAVSAFLSEIGQSGYPREARCVAGQEPETLETFVLLVFDFFRGVPDIGNDRLRIQLRPSMVELCVLLVARTRVAPDGSFRTLENNLTCEQLYARLPQLSDLLLKVMYIHEKLHACSLDDREFALLLILVLLQTGRSSDADLSSDEDRRRLQKETGAKLMEVFNLLIQYATLRIPGRSHLTQQVTEILLKLRNLSERPDLNINIDITLTGQSALTNFTSLFFPPLSYLRPDLTF